MVQTIKKVILIVASIVIIGALIKYHFLPTPYKYGDLMQPFNKQEYVYAFCKYEIPKSYKLVTYRDSDVDEKKLLFFKNTETGQLLILMKFRIIPWIDLKLISIQNNTVKYTYGSERTQLGEGFSYRHLLRIKPFRDDGIPPMDSKLTIRGFQKTDAQSSESIETEHANVRLFEGNFRNIGFYRSHPGIQSYPVPVFEFSELMNGMIAVINSKNTQETFFVVGAQKFGYAFNKDEFLQVVKSLSFEKNPPKELFGGKRNLLLIEKDGKFYYKEDPNAKKNEN